MLISSILNLEPLSSKEEEVLISMLSDPLVKKYLRRIGAAEVDELASMSSLGYTAEQLAIAHATVHGKLQVIDLLLSIDAPSASSSTVASN